MISIFILGLVSPTLFLAVFLKEGLNKNKVIRGLNWIYFTISIVSFVLIIIAMNINEIYDLNFSPTTDSSLLVTLWVIYLLSRCSEIFYAFLRDALDKISLKDSKNRINFPNIIKLFNFLLKKYVKSEKHIKIKEYIALPLLYKNNFLRGLSLKSKIHGTPLKNHDRLILSFRSYFELIINFSIVFCFLPGTHWGPKEDSLNIIEAAYFSGVTITTLGYGDISPELWFSQFLSVFEVLCGFTLIVVCLAVYLKDEQKS
jgi:voltage-gated potassium channel